MDINCIVDIASREVSFQENYRIAAYDHNVDVIHFSVEPIEDFSLNTSSIKIAAQGPNNVRHDYAVDPSTVAIEEETGYITFDWPIPAGVTEMPIGAGFKYGDRGQLIFAVCAEIISGSTVSKAWHSDDGIITVVAHLEPEAGGGEDPEEEATNAQKIGQLQTATAILQREISGIASGTPPTANSTSEMDPDESTVYINTTDGNWYYWNGSAWTSGGVYGGAVTDTTLSISGAAADAKAVGDALSSITIEVDDTLTEQGKAADSKAVGDALAEKADADDVTALETAVEGKADEADLTALDTRVTTLESGGDDVPYEERGDLYTLFASAEVEEMRKSNYRLQYNSTTGTVTAQSYTSNQNAIHYIDPALIEYPRLWFHRVTTYEWSVYADYDPDNDSYTLITTGPPAGKGKLIGFSTVPEGHYIAVSSPSAYWKTGYYIYLGRVWIKPGYTPKHDGWDVPVSNEPIPCELYPVSVSYPAFYIDMDKYRDRLVRLINSGTMVGTYGIRAYTDLAGTSYVDVGTAGFFSVGDFSAWIYPGRYLMLFYRGKMTENTFNLTMGYVPVENARKCKEIGKWGAQFALHNADTLNELIFACAVGSIVDLDVCRTLDGYFVCIHATTINGHTIAQTNLADLELTYNQMEVTDALKLMREYGVTCYFNFRETTPEQALDLTERAYNYLGKAIVYDDTGILNTNSVMAGHLNKYFVWCSAQTLDAVIALGAKTGRIFAWATKLENTSYNVGDIIRVKSVASSETLSNFAWDGECAYLWINSDIPGFVRG